MKELNLYIIEKLKINKDSVSDETQEKAKEKIINYLTNISRFVQYRDYDISFEEKNKIIISWFFDLGTEKILDSMAKPLISRLSVIYNKKLEYKLEFKKDPKRIQNIIILI